MPALIRVHFAEAFVALQLDALARGFGHRLEQADGPVNRGFAVLASQQAGTRKGLLQPGCVLVELARVRGAKQRVVDDGDVLDAADGAFERKTLTFGEAPDPAPLDLIG